MLHVRVEAPTFVRGRMINRAVDDAIDRLNSTDRYAFYGPVHVVIEPVDDRPVLSAAYDRGYALAPFDAPEVSPIDRAVVGYGTAYARGYMDRLRADYHAAEYRALAARLRADDAPPAGMRADYSTLADRVARMTEHADAAESGRRCRAECCAPGRLR